VNELMCLQRAQQDGKEETRLRKRERGGSVCTENYRLDYRALMKG